MAHKDNSRRQLVVNRRYQVRFALILVLMHVNVGFLYQVVLHYRVRNLAAQAGSIEAFLELDPWTSIWPAMLVAGLISGLAVFFIGLRYSHQIVGPLQRIKRALRQMAAGERPERLEFREGDVLEELAEEVNKVADAVGGPVERQRGPAVDPASILGEPAEREPVSS